MFREFISRALSLFPSLSAPLSPSPLSLLHFLLFSPSPHTPPPPRSPTLSLFLSLGAREHAGTCGHIVILQIRLL